MPATETPWDLPSQGLLDRTHRLLLRLTVCYATVSVAGLAATQAPLPWVHEAREAGVAGLTLGAALLATSALGSVCLITGARRVWRNRIERTLLPLPRAGEGAKASTLSRFRARRALTPTLSREERERETHHFSLRVSSTGRLAQGVLLPVLAGLAGYVAWRWRGWPPGPAADPALATVLAGLAALLAFPALVAERFVAALSGSVLPEAPALRRLLAVPVATALVAAAIEAFRAQGITGTAYTAGVAAACLVLQSAELAARGLARWFQPPTDPATTRAPIGSLVASLPGWLLRPGTAAEPLRTHFGLDFSRSWALSFLRTAALPATVLTGLACWGLSGVVLLPLDGRGVYERFGKPVAVLEPGLHMTLPWPMGRVRPVDFGAVHEIPLGGDAPAVALVSADAPAPPDADRLWDKPHPNEADWLIAGSGTSGQSFQVMSADIRILYRIGLTDADAMHAAYGVSDPDLLVRTLAGQTVSRFFAGRTLDSVLDQRREHMAADLQVALARALDRDRTGLEIVSVTVEAVHPPAAAASAYHNVQAAEIIANTSIATEIGRAKGTASLAREQSWDALDKSRAAAAETVSAADGDGRRFAGDQAAQAAGGQAFLLERYFQTLSAALSRSPLTILDHRVAPGTAPVIDLRPFATAAKTTGNEDPD